MCKFFSFVTKGDGKIFYASAALRAERGFDNGDSHSWLAEMLKPKIGEGQGYCDVINKYEYTDGQLVIDQINVTDDSKAVAETIKAFAETAEFKALKAIPESYERILAKNQKDLRDALRKVPERGHKNYLALAKQFSKCRDPHAGLLLPGRCGSTRLLREDADPASPYMVSLHGTHVVTMYKDGSCKLSSGGWQTMTTKDRICFYSPCNIFSMAGTWFVGPKGCYPWYSKSTKKVFAKFFDGIQVDAKGFPIRCVCYSAKDLCELERVTKNARARKRRAVKRQAWIEVKAAIQQGKAWNCPDCAKYNTEGTQECQGWRCKAKRQAKEVA